FKYPKEIEKIKGTETTGRGTQESKNKKRGNRLMVGNNSPDVTPSDPAFRGERADTTPRNFLFRRSHPATCFGICIFVQSTTSLLKNTPTSQKVIWWKSPAAVATSKKLY